MIDWRLLTPWFLRAWPLLALVPVGAIHLLAFREFTSHPALVHKLVGVTLQFLGGLLVLYSVNDNLGLFRSQSLTTAVISWFKDFPVLRKSVSLTGSVSSASSATASLSVAVTRSSTTLEERVAEVERLLVQVQQQLAQEVHAIGVKLSEAKSELSKQIDETAVTVSDLSRRLEHAAVGGFKFQALGVLLALYGAVASVFA